MTSLHRLELGWADGYRLDIEARATTAAPGEPVASPLAGVDSVLAYAASEPGGPVDLELEPDVDGLLEAVHLRENAEYVVTVRVPMSRSHAETRWRANEAGSFWPFASARVAGAVRLMPPRYWREETSPGGPATEMLASANFGSFVGVVDLSVGTHQLRAEVASSKIGYFDDFRALLDEVASDFLELLFQVDSVSGYRFAVGEPGDVTPATALFHLRRLMRETELPAAVEAIVHHPYTRLTEEDRVVQSALARSVLPDRLAASAGMLSFEPGGPLATLFRGHTPGALVETIRRDTVDTPENRYVKAVLEDLVALLGRLEPVVERQRKVASLREIAAWRDRLDDLLADPVWRDVGPLRHIPTNSQVLLRRDAYRQVAQADLLLQYGLVLPWERAQEIADEVGDIRPIFELYEYSCFFALRRILRSMCGPEAQQLEGFYLRRDDRLHVDLRRGRGSGLVFNTEIDGDPVRVGLFYNRSFNKPADDKAYEDASYSTTFRPDISILASSGGSRHWLHFDAKYRLDVDEWVEQLSSDVVEDVESELAGDSEDRELFKKADLYKMHAYRDAIVGSRGAYVLFPARDAAPTLFVRHRAADYRASHALPSVGAFPLRPGASADQEADLRAFLGEVFTAVAQKGASYQEEAGFDSA